MFIDTLNHPNKKLNLIAFKNKTTLSLIYIPLSLKKRNYCQNVPLAYKFKIQLRNTTAYDG